MRKNKDNWKCGTSELEKIHLKQLRDERREKRIQWRNLLRRLEEITEVVEWGFADYCGIVFFEDGTKEIWDEDKITKLLKIIKKKREA